MPIVAALLFALTKTPSLEVNYDFHRPNEATKFVATQGGEGKRKDGAPHIENGQLALLGPWSKSWTAVGFACPSKNLYRVFDAEWTTTLSQGTEGYGFGWINGPEGAAPENPKWEEPDVNEGFSVGFQASDPVNKDPFRGAGNIEGRPQHEASLHWNGREIIKAVTPTEYRDAKPHKVNLHVEYVTGGAEVTLKISNKPVWNRLFIPGMTPQSGRPAFGARNGETAGEISIQNVKLRLSEQTPKPEAPVHVTAIDHVLNDKDHGTNAAITQFPPDTSSFGRIIMTLRLDKPASKFDPWDRIAHIWIEGDDHEKYELLRYITPYSRGWEWKLDVTDLRPLLKGTHKVIQECGTYGEGWVVSVDFDFYHGKVDREAYKVVKLWSGAPEIGNPNKPTEAFYTPQLIPTDRQTTGAKVLVTVTGHGMDPNTNNAAEFMPLGRMLTINGRSTRNVLWKTDNYLNPCRPQGGTWKYDRAGWGPGTVVPPWGVEVGDRLIPGQPIQVTYQLDPYLNKGRGKTWAPTHATESLLVLFRKPTSTR